MTVKDKSWEQSTQTRGLSLPPSSGQSETLKSYQPEPDYTAVGCDEIVRTEPDADHSLYASQQDRLKQFRCQSQNVGSSQVAYVELNGTPQQKAQFHKQVNSDPQLRSTYQKAQNAPYPVKLKFVESPNVLFGATRGLGNDSSYHRIDLQDLESARKADPKLGKVLSNSALLHELTEANQVAKTYARPENRQVQPNSDAARKIYDQGHAQACKVENAYLRQHGMGDRGDGTYLPRTNELDLPFGTKHEVVFSLGDQPVGVEFIRRNK